MLLSQPAVILYILVVAPVLERETLSVIQALRPLVLTDDDHFRRMVGETSAISVSGEILAIVGGLLLGLLLQARSLFAIGGWLDLYQVLVVPLGFGLLAWTICAAFATTRSFSQLHRQPLSVDIFDIGPFEAVGRHSLTVALVFVGGIVLSTLLGLGSIDFRAWQSWLSYFIYALIPVAIFFFSMRGTHHMLANAKRQELQTTVRANIALCRTLLARLAAGENGGDLAAQINALSAYEQRVRATRTWPYNTPMLRTLFLSVIAPAAAGLARAVTPLLLDR